MDEAATGTNPAPAPPVRGAHTFSLSQELAAFVAYVLPRVVPVYAAHYDAQIRREWSKVAARFADKSPTTQKLYVSKFRKSVELAILEVEPKPERRDGIMSRIKSIVKNDPTIIELVNATYSAKVVENTRKLIFVRKYREIVALGRSWLQVDDDALLAIGLMLITGRRFYEVLVAGEFYPAAQRLDGGAVRGRLMSKWSLDFRGQLKTREAEGTRFDQRFPIPTLAPVNEVLPALERLRASELGQFARAATQEAANTSINPKLNRVLRRSGMALLWPSEDSEFSLKSTRALYAEICFKHHAPAGIHKDTYFSQILGHREGDLRTALSYVRYYLDEKDSEEARRELLRIAADQERQVRTYAEERAADTSGIAPSDRVKSRPQPTKLGRDHPKTGDVTPEAIKDLLRQKGIELGAFALSIGKHRTTIWRNMVGTGNPQIHQALAKVLGRRLEDLWPSRYSVPKV